MWNVACPNQVSFTPCRSIIRAPSALALPPCAPPTSERDCVFETHLLEIQRSQRGPAATATIDHNFATLVSGHLIDVAVEYDAGDVFGFWNRFALMLVSFANINKIEILLRLLHLLERWNIDFLYLFLRFIHDLVKFRHRHDKILPQEINFKQGKTELANFSILVQNVCM